MKKVNYHIYHISFLFQIFNGLKDSGVSLDNIISKSDIKRFNLNNPDTYLPMNVVYDFIQKVQKDQAIENIASTFYPDFDLASLGEYGEFLADSPDLLTVVLDGINFEHLFQTNTKMNLNISGAYAKFSSTHLDPVSDGRLIAEDIAFALAIQGFKMVLGKNWIPPVIQVRGNTAK